MAGRSPSGFRADVQALRALAVTGVVLNHLWPNRLTGGYVGVDVFFVISGYLISLHLLRELTTTGSVDLLAFYARRARRLLPAALLVVTVTLLAMLLVVPVTVWDRNIGEAVASTLYVENFQLVRLSVDYMAHDQAASAFQHYWSLSVEEQFYLLWPGLLLAAVALGRRWPASRAERDPGPVLRSVAAGVSAVVATSLVLSALQTAHNPTGAYFLTWTRAWEFGVGALVGVLATARLGRVAEGRQRPRPLVPATVAGGLAVAGWAAMGVAMVVFDASTPIPGTWALLPVLGAAAVIAGGEGRARAPLAPLAGLRPVQLLGDVSYSVYLWHWPLIVVLPYVTGEDGRLTRALVLALTVVLAWSTRRYVEVAGQRWAPLKATRRRAFVATAAGMATVLALSGGLVLVGDARTAAAADRLAAARTGRCFGAAALDPACGDPYRMPLVGPVSAADKDFHPAAPCAEDPDTTVADWKPRTDCDFSGGDDAALSVFLVGDSHAQMYLPALARAARQEGWRATGMAIGGCLPFSVPQSPRGIPGRAAKVCPGFGPAIDRAIAQDHPDVVVVSVASTREWLQDGSGRGQDEQYRDAMAAAFGRWRQQGAVVLGLVDVPNKPGVLDPGCTNQHLDDLSACSVERSSVARPGPFENAMRQLSRGTGAVALVDLTDHVCDPRTCRSVVGGANVLHDTNHLSATYSATLGPYLARAVREHAPDDGS